MQEIWNDIPEYEGLYQGSTLGNIRGVQRKCISKYGSIRVVPGKILKQSIVKGYYVIDICKLGIRFRFRSSRLLASAFFGLNINDRTILVCHKDDNPLNNRLSNLFLGTHQDNMDDMKRKGRATSNKKFPVFQYTKEGVFIKEWSCKSDASLALGINISSIGACCRKDKGYKSAGGYKWKYKY